MTSFSLAVPTALLYARKYIVLIPEQLALLALLRSSVTLGRKSERIGGFETLGPVIFLEWTNVI